MERIIYHQPRDPRDERCGAFCFDIFRWNVVRIAPRCWPAIEPRTKVSPKLIPVATVSPCPLVALIPNLDT